MIAVLSAAVGNPNGSRRLLDVAIRRCGLLSVLLAAIAVSGTPIAMTAAFALGVAAATYIADAMTAVATCSA